MGVNCRCAWHDALVGFHLDCVLTFDRSVLALYDRVVEGGSAWATPVEGPGLPSGWVLPMPWALEYELGNRIRAVAELLDPATADAWRLAAGIPADADPLDAFDDTDFHVASLLSLAAPPDSGVVCLSDETFGGVLFHENAAAFIAGQLRAACGIRFGDRRRGEPDRAFELHDGTYREADPAAVSPVADCAAVIDERFRGAFLFDGYLPRDAIPHDERMPAPAQPLGPVTGDWATFFPILAAADWRGVSG